MSTGLDEQEDRLLTAVVASSLSFSKRISHFGDFLFTRVPLRAVDDFLLTRVSLRTIWRFFFKHSRISTSGEGFVSTRSSYEQLAVFFNLAYLYETGDLIFLTRVLRRAICFKAERLTGCQLVSQNPGREICCARGSESPSLRINWKVSC